MNPLASQEFKTCDRNLSFIETATSSGKCIVIYSILLADMLGRLAELQITEEDCVIIVQNLLNYTQFLMLSQFT